MTVLKFRPSLQAALVQGAALAVLSACAGATEGGSSDLSSGGLGAQSGGADGTTGGNGPTGTGGGAATGGAATGGAATGGAATGGVGTGASSASGGATATGGVGPFLPELPERECVGEDHGDGPGYYGRCCPRVSCMPAEAGACPTSDAGVLSSLPGYPPGSGSCGCFPVEGPFSLGDATTMVQGEGECCYVIYSIGCDGRPLRQEDATVVASALPRADWGGGQIATAGVHD